MHIGSHRHAFISALSCLAAANNTRTPEYPYYCNQERYYANNAPCPLLLCARLPSIVLVALSAKTVHVLHFLKAYTAGSVL